ncbi:hypothetical protein LJB98_01015 [Bacteroidales bacterium OttesenSCG-928-M11]|nr:hypothetical protein [Bacteroidales bacterium OttesenSCG-928-M11]
MSKILSFIEKETNGKCYKSFKFCHDIIAVPSVAYEDNLDDKISLKEFGETDHSPQMRDMTRKSKQLETLTPLFRYFLDGSRRTYRIDDIEYRKKIYPIIAGQIGVGCCERIDKSTFQKTQLEHNLVISLPMYAYADGFKPELFFNNLTEKINQLPALKKYNLHVSKILPYSDRLDKGETYENKGIAKIQDEMIESEKKIVAELTAKNLLNQSSYLVKDGSLQYKPMKTGDYREISKIRNNYRCVIGVSKQFNPELIKDRNNKSNASTIAHLKLFHRTPAFMYQPGEQFGDVKFAVWYVRIRDAEFTNTPFSGILKIEKMLMTGSESENGLETDEIDIITANIINERNPVCYGNDNRWANHLYPIYLTERFIKSQYISDLHLLNLF